MCMAPTNCKPPSSLGPCNSTLRMRDYDRRFFSWHVVASGLRPCSTTIGGIVYCDRPLRWRAGMRGCKQRLHACPCAYPMASGFSLWQSLNHTLFVHVCCVCVVCVCVVCAQMAASADDNGLSDGEATALVRQPHTHLAPSIRVPPAFGSALSRRARWQHVDCFAWYKACRFM